jgi:threonine dehydrogenase-like Zn-dependent dehydrogenase
VVGANVACGECYYCRHDFPYYCCEKMTDYGNNLSAKNAPHLFGGWSQYMYIAPGSFLVKVPDDLPSEIAGLTDIFAVSVGHGPGMRQMVRYQKQYPVREFVSHRYKLRDVHAAVQKSIEPESMKVVLEPWS